MPEPAVEPGRLERGAREVPTRKPGLDLPDTPLLQLRGRGRCDAGSQAAYNQHKGESEKGVHTGSRCWADVRLHRVFSSSKASFQRAYHTTSGFKSTWQVESEVN